MARKRPSAHSDEQFALFVEQMKSILEGGAGSDFDEAVRRLIGSSRTGRPDDADEDVDDEQEAVEAASPSAFAPSSPSQTFDDLPEPPDFEAIEAAARDTGASRATLMVLIGKLVLGSANNESLLIYILMVLLQTDEPSAAVVFSTLNTTRARLDLVSRLAKIRIGDPETRDALDEVIKHFNEANRIRNEFLHAMYTVDGKGSITHTQNMRLITKNGRTSFGDQTPIDQKRLDGMVTACRDLSNLNRKIWDLLPRLQDAIARTNPDSVVR